MKVKKAMYLSLITIIVISVSFFGVSQYRLYKLKSDSKAVFTIVYKNFTNNTAPTEEEKQIINEFGDKYLVDTKFSYRNRHIIFDTIEVSGHLIQYYSNGSNKTQLEECKEHAIEISLSYTK